MWHLLPSSIEVILGRLLSSKDKQIRYYDGGVDIADENETLMAGS